MAIQFTCDCGQVIRAKDEHAGKATRCVKCGTTVRIPDRALIQSTPETAISVIPQSHENPTSAATGSITIVQILLALCAVWAVLLILTVVVATTSVIQFAGMLLFDAVITVVFLAAMIDLFVAKKNALHIGRGDAWFGLVSVIAWDPTEGILFLNDKLVSYVDSNPQDGGGVRIIFPFLGEEEAFRAVAVHSVRKELRSGSGRACFRRVCCA